MSSTTPNGELYRPVAGTVRKSIAPALFVIRGKLSSRTDLIIGLSAIGILAAIWCLVSYTGLVRNDFLPTPTLIWEGLVEYHQRGWLFPAIGRSCWRVVQALFWVLLLGIPFGVLLGTFAPVDAVFRKIVNGGKAVPITAMTMLVVLWFGFEERGKVVFLFLGTIFFMTILVKNAIMSVNEDYVRVALDVGASRWQVIRRVLLPGALPQIWDAIAVCIGIMWTYIILAEIIYSSVDTMGVGYLLSTGYRASGGGNGAGKVFGMVIVIAVISSLTDFVLMAIRKKFINW
jgi:NitT/TauT family transport system permease protein